MSIESVMPSNHLILCYPILLASIFTSIRVFSNELTLHIRWPEYCSFSFSISPSNEYTQTHINIDIHSFIHSSGFLFGNLNELFGQPNSYTNKTLFVIYLKCKLNLVSWIFLDGDALHLHSISVWHFSSIRLDECNTVPEVQGWYLDQLGENECSE